jgi:energy-coupling factor transporter transmembrane protein EcfT
MATQGFSIRLNGIIGFVFMVLVFVALFFVAKGIFTVLAWIAPVLIGLALLINYRTILNYLKFMLSLLQRNPLGGIIGILLSFFGFPILAGVLFGKSILDRKVRKLNEAYQARQEAEYVEYEEVIKPEKETKLDLPPLKKDSPILEEEPPAKKDNRYEDLF